MTHSKIGDGLNERARDTSIGQSADGLPDDSGRPVDVEEAKAARIEAAILGDDEGGEESEAHPS